MISFIFQPSKHGEKARLWSARVRLDEWPRSRTFRLHVTDKRVADQKLRELVSELERETHGVGIPRPTREALRAPLLQHHAAFMAAGTAAGLSPRTLIKYGQNLPNLFKRCGWTTIRDVTPASFTRWRDDSALKPKSVNDLLGSMRTFLLWMKRQRLILADPLAEVRKVSNPNVGNFRRALSIDEINRLLDLSPPYRARVYLAMIYTGLRRSELNGLKWGDFNFETNPPYLKVPSSLSKNRQESTHHLRPELAAALLAARPNGVRPERWVFRGSIPRVPTMQKDLATAGIPFEDARGRRMDIHALRKTYGTLLASSGVSPQVAMQLMRHSDMKLTMGVYTDVAQLPIIQETARLPSFQLPKNSFAQTGKTYAQRDRGLVSKEPRAVSTGAQLGAQRSAQTGVPACPELSSPVAGMRDVNSPKPIDPDLLGHEKAPQGNLRRFSEMERAKRLELSTSTLARWCSTN
jgi:integrase